MPYLLDNCKYNLYYYIIMFPRKWTSSRLINDYVRTFVLRNHYVSHAHVEVNKYTPPPPCGDTL